MRKRTGVGSIGYEKRKVLSPVSSRQTGSLRCLYLPLQIYGFSWRVSTFSPVCALSFDRDIMMAMPMFRPPPEVNTNKSCLAVVSWELSAVSFTLFAGGKPTALRKAGFWSSAISWIARKPLLFSVPYKVSLPSFAISSLELKTLPSFAFSSERLKTSWKVNFWSFAGSTFSLVSLISFSWSEEYEESLPL